MMKKSLFALAILFAAASTAFAITIDGDFSDFTDDMIVGTGTDNGGLYIVDIRVTNDDDFVYVNYNYSAPSFALGQFTGFDVDLENGDVSMGETFTGFNFFSANLGIDAAFQNDFPFQPAGNGTNDLFNSNDQALPTEFFGHDGVSPGGLNTAGGDPLFGTFSYQFDDGVNPPLPGVEFSLAIDGTLGDGTPLFTIGEEFGILVGIDGINPSVVTGTYTLVPEPASVALFGIAGVATLLIRRRS